MNDIKQAFFHFKHGGWKPLFITYLVLGIVSATILTPLAGAALRLTVSFSGQAALSDTEIATVLLTPVGAIAGIIVASVALTLGVLSYATLLIPARAYLDATPMRLAEIFSNLITVAPNLLKLSFHIIIRYLSISLPFALIIAADYYFLISDNDINYYLAKKPREFIIAVSIAGLAGLTLGLLLARLTLSWFFALPLVLFSQYSPRSAKKLSSQTTEGQKARILFALVCCFVVAPILGSFLSLPFSLLADQLIPHLTTNLPLLSLTLGGAVLLLAILNSFITFLALSLLALFNVSLFRENDLDPTSSTPRPTPRSRMFRIGLRDKLTALALVCILLVTGGICYRWLSQLQLNDSVLIIAHRGASLDAPENTLAAIKKAIDDQADWIEIDVQETADGDIVVFHDSDFKRVSSTPLNIWNADQSDIQALDIGSWFAPQFSSEKTPTLRQVLNLCRDKSGVLIELKYYGHDKRLEQGVIDIVEEMQMEDQVMLMSLSYPAVKKVRALRPSWKVGLLSTVALGDITQLDVDFLGLNGRAATPELIKRAHEAGIQVFVWTVNEPLDISAMASRGVDGIITDTPATARQVLQQRLDLEQGQRLLLELAHTFGKRGENILQ